MILFNLILFLTLEFLIAVFLFKGDVLAPAIVFSFVFVLSSLDLMLMSDFWNVTIQNVTFWILVIGVLSFIVGAYVAKALRGVHLRIGGITLAKYRENYQISKAFSNFMIAIYIIFIVVSMLYVIYSRGGSAITGLFGSYVTALGGDTKLDLPIYLSLPVKFLFLAGYVWGYLLVNNWIINRKLEFRYVILYLLTLIMSISNGKRGEMVALVITLIIYTLIALKKNRSKKLTQKVYITLFFILIAVALSFQSIATMMGRDSNLFEPLEYFSIYLGAPILNLNTSIMHGGFNHPTLLSETFHSLYTAIGENFQIDSFIYTTDRIFWSSPNGKKVGNVATTFYDFYHDGGFWGIIFLSFVMGFVAQIFYNSIKYEKHKNRMFYTMVYSYMLWMVGRSFFANSFFDWFTLSTIITLLIWWLYSVTIPKIEMRKGKRI